YYFHSSEAINGQVRFTYYPHIKHAVTLYKNSLAKTEGNRTVVHPDKAKGSVLYSTLRERPHQVELNGPFQKIGIVFKPYGLNRFVNKPLYEFNFSEISVFNEWDAALDTLRDEIWNAPTILEKTQLLDTFLKDQLKSETNEHFRQCLEEVLQAEQAIATKAILKNYYPNRKALYRVFKQELNCSPRTFLKTLKFRKSLEQYLKANSITLTEAAVAHFYDQSDFTKNLKQIAHTTPKELTRQVSDLDHAIFWNLE
ncbi:MAG: helix-turn-helix domain-containing protein, partial [Bacteroidota bacterium]|nr:helix-turn-helix domain-containing protein [Bacteroidota bacterium]